MNLNPIDLLKPQRLSGVLGLALDGSRLEGAVLGCIAAGVMTRDLARIVHGTMDPPRSSWVDTAGFIDAVARRLAKSST